MPPKERALLGYVEVLTLRPAEVTDELTEGLRTAGWKDEEIFEAAFVTALFAFFNRMSESYGLDWVPGGWRPPAASAFPAVGSGAPAPTEKATKRP